MRRLTSKPCALGVLLTAAAVATAAGPESAPRTLHPTPDTEMLESYNLAALKRIYFLPGSSSLGPNEIAALDQVINHLPKTPGFVVELRGYADGTASTATNLTLSVERANEVARLLADHGVGRDRILILGLGEVDPAAQPLLLAHQRVDIRVFVPRAAMVTIQHESPSREFVQDTWGGK